jgi:nitroreductase
MDKRARTAHPVQEVIANRWSPYAFADQEVSAEDLRCLFEAARWAPSSYNEQPWSYIVATRADRGEFERVLSCLVEGNQAWAKAAPVLALGVATLNFKRNDKPNRAALHDLGLAAGNLVLEATARGLVVHQMIGIVPERARELYAIPAGSEAVTGLAIGTAGAADALPAPLQERDLAPRERKTLAEFVFAGAWGTPFEGVR